MGIVSSRAHRIQSQTHKRVPQQKLQTKTSKQSKRNLLSNVDHTLPAQNQTNPLTAGSIATNYNRNFVASAYLPAMVSNNSTESYLNRTVTKKSALELSDPLPVLDPTTAYFNTCPQPKIITDCCENASWFFDCGTGKKGPCVPNRTSGAWVCAPVSYAAAVDRCQQIKGSLADGRNKVFSNQFENSFR